MKGQYMLILSREDGGMFPTWHKTEADALQYIMDIPYKQWFLIGVGDDGTQRDPNEHPIIFRTSASKVNENG